MSAAKVPTCTLGPKHKWEWKKDVTNMSLTITGSSARRSYSRRGVFACKCGVEKFGMARSGL